MVAEAWNWEEEKAFENAFAINYETCCDWLEKLAAAVPEKTLEEIKRHYEILIEDVGSIESGRVPLPNYASPSSSSSAAEGSCDGGGNGQKCRHSYGDYSIQGGKSSRFEHERRKGISWTEEEHRLFLLGLDKYGKGDWRSISRNFVISRTPTQVASHAQKYFIRLNSMNKDRRRSSIHDITNVNNGDASASQGPITGQSNSYSAASAPGIAVGTPVAGLPMAYRVQPPPIPGVFIAGTPVCFTAPVVYPVHNSTSQR